MTSLAHPSPGLSPPSARDGLLHDLVRDQSLRTPDAPAVTDATSTLTYRQLQERADALSVHLADAGCGPRTLVGIALHRSADAVAAVLAVLNVGAAYVPLDPAYPVERLRAVVTDARPRLVLADDLEEAARLLGDDVPAVAVGAIPPAPAGGAAGVPRGQAEPHTPAYVIHTSGSTGRPKGVVVPHRAIRSRVIWETDAFPSGPGDSVLHRTSLAFDISLQEIFPPLVTGARVVVADDDGQRDPAHLVRLLARENVTTLALVPSLLRALLDEDEGLRSCPRLREVFVGGERLDRPLHDRFLRHATARLHNMYGPTEYAVDATYWTCRPLPPGQEVPIGHPLARTALYVLDEALRPVPDGATGQLAIAGDQLALGYLGDEEATGRAFPDNPFVPGTRMYLTGDLVRRRPDGALEFIGRGDDQVKVRGHRIELGDVEAHLLDLPRVRAAAARAFTDPDGQDTVLVGYVVAGPNDIDPRALRRALAERVPAPLVPADIVALERLPLGPTGKTDRAALPDPRRAVTHTSDQQTGAAQADGEPGDETARAVVEVFAEVLRRPAIGPHDDFFDLGGSSLQAARLVNRLRKRLGRDLALATLFEASTPAGIAAVLQEAPRAGT
ncbi:amino acid adenylation domain-containing protein [Streptomyces sp. NPDC048192]|uniref:non-ribosomal peptide synthetase n=1 Tax=Streptomyces sp. NPDC048192 TaxID=3365510 RepID=UPI0037223182